MSFTTNDLFVIISSATYGMDTCSLWNDKLYQSREEAQAELDTFPEGYQSVKARLRVDTLDNYLDELKYDARDAGRQDERYSRDM